MAEVIENRVGNPSSWIAAFIFLGFLVFITVKGELPNYYQAIFGTQLSTPTGGGGGGGY